MLLMRIRKSEMERAVPFLRRMEYNKRRNTRGGKEYRRAFSFGTL